MFDGINIKFKGPTMQVQGMNTVLIPVVERWASVTRHSEESQLMAVALCENNAMIKSNYLC